MEPQTSRDRIPEEEEYDVGVYEQEYVTEEEINNEESHLDYNGVQEVTLAFPRDYPEEEEKEVCDEQKHDVEEQGSVFLTHHDFLDCPIFYKPLVIPVFQCGNGHVICSSCNSKINNICAYCRHPIDTRNRLIEGVLESARAKCKNTKYGCKEVTIYKKKYEHEMTCLCKPRSCPFSDCNFVGSSSQLYSHFSIKHKNNLAVTFSYNRPFHMTLKADDKFLILQEEKDKFLFVLDNFSENRGNAISVSCIISISDELQLDYDIKATDSSGIHRQQFQSVMISRQKLDNKPPSTGFLLVPSYFFGYNDQLELDICIRKCVKSISRKRRHS